MIRRASHQDLPVITDLGEAFHAVCPYSWAAFDREAFASFCGRLIDGGVIFLSEDGMIGGCLSPMFFNPTVRTAAEMFWFARVDGRALREAFEEWARAQGAAGVTCSALANEHEPRMRTNYARAGYEAAEVAFVKRFQP